MTETEFGAALKAYYARRPFRPFVVEFVSGESLTVAHPDCVARRNALYFFRGAGGLQCLFAASSVCRLFDYLPLKR